MAIQLTFGRETWVGPDACSFGDYGGYGSIGRANIDEVLEQARDSVAQMSFSDFHSFIEFTEKRRKPTYRGCFEDLVETARKLRNRPDAIHVAGDYGSECVLIRQGWEWGKETTDALEDYPCIDDERVSEVETEWEQEAWKDWLRNDLSRHMGRDGYSELELFFDGLDDDGAWTLYREAMEEANVYPEAEYNGVHVDVARVGPVLLKLVEQRYDDARKAEIAAALRTYHAGQGTLFDGEHLPDPEGIAEIVAEEFAARYL